MTKAQLKKTEDALFDLINKSGKKLKTAFENGAHGFIFNTSAACAAAWR